MIGALQRIVSRRLPPGEPGVVTVGMISAGTAPNVIPERAELRGTLRAVRAATRRILQDELHATATATAEAHRARANVSILEGPPPIVNASEPIQWARGAVGTLLGDHALVGLPAPNLGGEDFACYLRHMAGCFLRVGARAPDQEAIPAHSAQFLPDDHAVVVGAAVLAETARRASAALVGSRDGRV
jgi:hippurate hydrolase